MPLIFNISHNLEFDCTPNTFNVHFWQGFSKISAFVSCTDNGNYVPFVLKLTNLIWKRNKLMKRNKSWFVVYSLLFYNIYNVKKKNPSTLASSGRVSVAPSYLHYLMFLEWRLMMWTNTRLFQINTRKKR